MHASREHAAAIGQAARFDATKGISEALFVGLLCPLCRFASGH
jgi:hypothetical protein